MNSEMLKAVLREHWLFAVTCNEETHTDTTSCSCAKFSCDPQPNVGQAVERWIEHIAELLAAAPRPLEAGTPGDTITDERLSQAASYIALRLPENIPLGGNRDVCATTINRLLRAALSQPLAAPDVTKLAELSEKATAGEWACEKYDTRQFIYQKQKDLDRDDRIAYVYGAFADKSEQAIPNAAFIVACVNFVREALQKLPGTQANSQGWQHDS